MKKIFLTIGIVFTCALANAQLIPNFDFGLKAGINLAKISGEDRLNSENRLGNLVGVWARVGAMGLHLQPELYYTVKGTEVSDGKVNFSSIDIPVLVGTKIGALGIGGRLNTGPVVSFIIDEEQSLNNALNNASQFNYKDQAFAWQFGAGLDIKKISLDLRYERGLSKISRSGFDDTKLNLFNLSLGLKLY